jgi:hypothetical protein
MGSITTDDRVIPSSRTLRRSIVSFMAGAVLAAAVAVGVSAAAGDPAGPRQEPSMVHVGSCGDCIPLFGPR